MDRDVGLALLVVGLVIVVLGGLAAMGWLSWFGRLPGDIRYDSGNVKVFVPITTMILLSVLLSVAVAIWRRLS